MPISKRQTQARGAARQPVKNGVWRCSQWKAPPGPIACFIMRFTCPQGRVFHACLCRALHLLCESPPPKRPPGNLSMRGAVSCLSRSVTGLLPAAGLILLTVHQNRKACAAACAQAPIRFSQDHFYARKGCRSRTVRPLPAAENLCFSPVPRRLRERAF